MNIGFYDPISERWIKPRPEPNPEVPEAISLGEALLRATEAAALKERNERIWQYLKQSAEGCNAPTGSKPAYTEAGGANLQWDDRPLADQIADVLRPPIVTSVPPE